MKDHKMKQLIFACGFTVFALISNQCIAQTTSGIAVNKTAANSAQASQRLNINKATAEQLEAIPGLGKKKAQAVLAYIAENGAIRDQSQLTQVKGIGEKLAAKIGPYLSYN